MVNITSSIDIHRPVAQVFDFISSPINDFEWQHGTLASGRLSEGAIALGDSFRSVGHLMGRRMVSTYEVTEYVPNRQYGFRTLTGPLVSRTLFTLESKLGSTRVKIVTEARPEDGSSITDRNLEKYMQRDLKDNLAILKTILEEKAKPGNNVI